MVVAGSRDKIGRGTQKMTETEAEAARSARVRAAAERALREAEERRKAPPPERPKETGNRKGPEPTRYGDWEKKGIAYDF
jgi:hypothetical protein